MHISKVTDTSVFEKIKQINFWQDLFMKIITIGLLIILPENTFEAEILKSGIGPGYP